MRVEGQIKKRAAVVVPLKNERHGLDRLLAALSRQLGEADEVICIDAGSTDGTWETLCCFAGLHPQFKVLREEDAFPGRARNAAIRNTDARFIAQIDGGNIPHDHWLSKILYPLVAGRADYVMGDVAVKPIMKTLWGRSVDMGRFYGASLFRGPHIRGRALRPPAGGAAVAYHRRVWQQAGGFPEWLRTGEDRLFARKVMQQNPRIVFAEEAVVDWQIGPTLLDFLKRHHYHQRIKAGQAGENGTKWKGIVLQAGFLASAAAAILFPGLRPLPVIIFCVAVLQQALKSARTYYHRSPQPEVPPFTAFPLFLALESLVFPAKLLGSISGLFRKKDDRRRQKQTEEYLTS